MATLDNLGFEDAGAGAGDADLWTRSATGGAAEVAAFHTAPKESRFEDLEREWSSNEDFLFEFGIFDLDLAPFIVDGFEGLWLGNEAYLFELSAVELALFDVALDAFEDLEEEWLDNENWSGVLGAVDDALFDVALDAFEDLEEEWLDNENWSDVLGAVDVASFRFLGGDVNFEVFEGVYEDIPITVNAALDQITAPSHGLAGADKVSFRNEGGRVPDGLLPGFVYSVLVVDVNIIQVEGVVGDGAIDLLDGGIGATFLQGDPVEFWLLEP